MNIRVKSKAAPAHPATVSDRSTEDATNSFFGIEYSCSVGEERRPTDCDVLLPQSIYRKIMAHLSSDMTRELGGLLLGEEIRSLPGSRPAVLIREAVPARFTASSRSHLTFTEESWVEFDRQIEGLPEHRQGLARLGWYHSHPAMPIFLSARDLDVCSHFTRPTQLALVIDPVGSSGGFFVHGGEGYRERAPQGFWEIKDLCAEPLAAWQNLRRVTGVTAEVLNHVQILGLSDQPDVGSVSPSEPGPLPDTGSGSEPQEVQPTEEESFLGLRSLIMALLFALGVASFLVSSRRRDETGGP